MRGHFFGVCVGDDQTQEHCSPSAIYFGGHDCVGIVLVVLRGISLYDRGNKVWRQRSDSKGLLYVIDFSHRAGRSKLALHFANLGLRVYEPNRQAPKDGQVGFSNVALRRGDGAGLLPVIATLLLGGRFKKRPNPKAPSPHKFGGSLIQ